MSLELRGLIAGVVAALFVVGASFGVSALVIHEHPAETQTKQSTTPKTPSSGQLLQTGLALYGQYCANCHGDKAQGGFGPNLHHLGDPDAKVERNIANGVPPRMPAFKKKLNGGQLKAVTAYVQTLE